MLAQPSTGFNNGNEREIKAGWHKLKKLPLFWTFKFFIANHNWHLHQLRQSIPGSMRQRSRIGKWFVQNDNMFTFLAKRMQLIIMK